MAELFGFSIQRSKRDKGSEVTFTTPDSDDGSIEISGGGFFGQVLDLDGRERTELDLIKRYRRISQQSECDAAIEDIVNIYLDNSINKIESEVKMLDRTYNNINPYNVLNRGYTFLLNEDRENISSIHSTNVGKQIFSLHADGELKLEVLEKYEKDKRKK